MAQKKIAMFSEGFEQCLMSLRCAEKSSEIWFETSYKKLIEAVGKFCGQGAAGLYSADKCDIRSVFSEKFVAHENLPAVFFV